MSDKLVTLMNLTAPLLPSQSRKLIGISYHGVHSQWI